VQPSAETADLIDRVQRGALVVSAVVLAVVGRALAAGRARASTGDCAGGGTRITAHIPCA
jgi:hypothetical protein